MMSATVCQPDALSAGVCTLARVQSVLPSWILCCVDLLSCGDAHGTQALLRHTMHCAATKLESCHACTGEPTAF